MSRFSKYTFAVICPVWGTRKISLYLAGLCVFLGACLRLDSQLFNNDGSIEKYYLDAYTGEVDFILDESYTIPDSLVHLFTLESDNNGDVATIYALYIGRMEEIATDTVILYCHGNRDHMDFYWQRAKLMANTGGKNRFGVMMFDYRGYGLSEGTPSEENLYADANAALEWLKSYGLTGERLVMYGYSLGSAPATELTAFPRALVPSKLVLESPFASSETMVQDGTKLSLPASFFTNAKIDNADKIEEVEQPFLWLHGTEDDFLALETHGETVFKNYKGLYSEAHRVDGAGHNDVPLVVGFENYLSTLEHFLEK